MSKTAMCLLLIGCLTGAGILALPVQIGIAGLIPSLAGMLTLGACMLFSGMILAYEVADSHDDLFHYPTLFGRYLGSTGKWVAIGANALVIHGLMVAYLAGGAAVITRFLGRYNNLSFALLLFFMVLSAIIICGKRMIHRGSSILIIAMWALFGLILFISQKHVHLPRYASVDWKFFPFSLPVILTAYWYHGIIPNVCRHLEWSFKDTIKVMIVAVLVATLMYVAWVLAAIGVIPLSEGADSLTGAFRQNLPVTVPMQHVLGGKSFLITSLFALAALTTSYISMSLGAIGFHEDLLRHVIRKKRRELILAVSFLPSFFIALFFPNIFLKAINLVGGVGIAILYGILPCIIGIIRSRRDKRLWYFIACSASLLIFSALLCWQAMVEIGLFRPHV
ncbi:MAG: hypothetical protein GY750_19180 [Lentisphaerae bacterium]|nr:hypothetical protein [Lentisphaerota bacterium]MCP4103521.1 hypothetical protein [Lentisphaerota bacterium]